ncbi:hypothetical protein Tco_0488191 [Tanacetum coccineum]
MYFGIRCTHEYDDSKSYDVFSGNSESGYSVYFETRTLPKELKKKEEPTSWEGVKTQLDTTSRRNKARVFKKIKVDDMGFWAAIRFSEGTKVLLRVRVSCVRFYGSHYAACSVRNGSRFTHVAMKLIMICVAILMVMENAACDIIMVLPGIKGEKRTEKRRVKYVLKVEKN